MRNTYLIPMNYLLSLMASLFLVTANYSHANEDPAAAIDLTVQTLLTEFTDSRDELESEKSELFDLVDRVAGPLFDFDYISKLVLAKSWKSASTQQRTEFAQEFKKLLIVTYATALFRYTGDEGMTFGDTKIKEKKGIKFAKVHTKVNINKGPPIAVVYDMIFGSSGSWKIYNLTVGDLNMVLNYRSVIQSSVHSVGLDGMISSMKENNQKNYK